MRPLCDSILLPLQCIPWLLLGSTTLSSATGTEVCSAELCIKDTEGRTGGCILDKGRFLWHLLLQAP